MIGPRFPRKLVLATGNPDKLVELRALLARHGIDGFAWEGLPDVVEDADTYEGNAALKATSAAAVTRMPALGDDAGLEVHAWGGRPGLETRRWAEQLGGWDAARARVGAEAGGRATFRCALAVAWPAGFAGPGHRGGAVVTALGSTEGALVAARSEGHGLEPCFVADGTDAALPRLSIADRDRVHHRVRALNALGALIEAAT